MSVMKGDQSQLSTIARRAVSAGAWATVNDCAEKILKQDKKSPEGHFLAGLVAKAAGRADNAVRAFSTAIKLDAGRYDAAIELAGQYATLLRLSVVLVLLQR